MTGRARRWQELTSEEAKHLAARDPVAMLPVAAIEQHGPHLPLATDRIIAEGIVDAALEAVDPDLPLAILPVQCLGTSEEHTAFTGTLSLSATTLERLIFDVGTSLAEAGIRRLVVFSAHGGNRATIDTAALRLRRVHGMLVVKIHYGRFPAPDDAGLPDAEWTHGLHGGAVETAMVMHLAPQLVRSDGVRDFPSLGQKLERELTWVAPEGVAPFAWSADDLSPDGVTGDARLASAELGERLVAYYGERLAEVLLDARRFPLDRLRAGPPRD